MLSWNYNNIIVNYCLVQKELNELLVLKVLLLLLLLLLLLHNLSLNTCSRMVSFYLQS